MAIHYKDILPVANGLIIAGTFFFLGLLFSNLPYDVNTLFTYEASEEAFANSIRHYSTWAQIPTKALWVLHFFLGLGYIGLFIRLYRPSDDSKYFDYGSLLLYVLASCIYLTNLKTGALSALHGEWGDVDQNTGINVIAASSAMAIFILGGIIMLQVGLYYGEWEYKQRLEAFNKEEEERLAKEAEAKETEGPKTRAKAKAEKAEPVKEDVKASGSKPATKQAARKRRS